MEEAFKYAQNLGVSIKRVKEWHTRATVNERKVGKRSSVLDRTLDKT